MKYKLYCAIISSPKAQEDFTPTTQLLLFSPTNTERSVSIPIGDDELSEGLEQFFVGLSFGSISSEQNIDLNPSTAVIMIGDNDGKLI